MRNLAAVLFFSMLAGACGTGVYNHRFEVAVNDPTKRLTAPVEVSVFDTIMGDTEDWARKSIGRASPGQPYIGEMSSTATKMFYDGSLPNTVSAGLFLPAVETAGYFVLSVTPVMGPEQPTTLKYASFNVPTEAENRILPLTARFSSVAAKKGWTIRLIVDVPPAEKKP